MIRAFYGLTQNPFDNRDLELLPQQQEIHDTLKVHCQQGGLCLVLGVPGSGKSVIKQSLQRLPENQHLVATVARTLHTNTNTVKILCDAFRIDFASSAFQCERRLIEQAFSLNHAGKALTTILDDAHLMDLANLRKLRLLFEDFPKNHNLVLIGRPSLLAALDLGVNPGPTHSIFRGLTAEQDVFQRFLVPSGLLTPTMHASFQALCVFEHGQGGAA
jgi:MSHA biogenesis protein MshM